jgi:hypothetical protein
MRRLLRHRPSPAIVIASTALLFALCSGGIAAIAALPSNSVGTPQLKKNAVISGKIKDDQVLSADIKNSTITTNDVKNGTLRKVDFRADQLPAGPPGPPGPPGATGFEQKEASTASNSGSPKTVSAVCSTGKRVIGGGARVTGNGAGQVSITESYPDPDGTKWNTRAVEINGTGSFWVLTAYALCATVGT